MMINFDSRVMLYLNLSAKKSVDKLFSFYKINGLDVKLVFEEKTPLFNYVNENGVKTLNLNLAHLLAHLTHIEDVKVINEIVKGVIAIHIITVYTPSEYLGLISYVPLEFYSDIIRQIGIEIDPLALDIAFFIVARLVTFVKLIETYIESVKEKSIELEKKFSK